MIVVIFVKAVLYLIKGASGLARASAGRGEHLPAGRLEDLSLSVAARAPTYK